MVQLLLVLIEFGTSAQMYIFNYKIMIPIILLVYLVMEKILEGMKKYTLNIILYIQYLLDQFLNIKNKGEF